MLRRIAPTRKVISFDSSYILMKNSNGNVSAKFVGIPINGAKKNVIWVPKVLVTNVVTNVQGPKKIWVPKRVTSFCMSITSLDEDIGCLIVGALNT